MMDQYEDVSYTQLHTETPDSSLTRLHSARWIKHRLKVMFTGSSSSQENKPPVIETVERQIKAAECQSSSKILRVSVCI